MRLSKVGEHQTAFEVLDRAIEELGKQGDKSSVVTLCHHAAILAGFASNTSRVKHYYGQSLAVDPDNAQALYGLADVALEKGETEVARQYAMRCHAALLQSEDGLIKQGLLELVGKHWPDIL